MFEFRLDAFLDSSARIGGQNTILANNLPNPSGIAISDKEIFIVQHGKVEIQVFDYYTFKHIRNISVPTMKNPRDITFSGNILFVGEFSAGMVHRVPLNLSEPMKSWSVGTSSELSLSTLKSGNILVTCYSLAKLKEYTTTGQLVREIPLQQDITNLYHAIQMDNDRFLVSHGGSLNRVWLTTKDNWSKVTEGLKDQDQDRCPIHITWPLMWMDVVWLLTSMATESYFWMMNFNSWRN